ncbi:MAG TPA: LmbZ [Parachlamydiales bacterium]|nr:LmbZ [Parachlamydiales bacterium]
MAVNVAIIGCGLIGKKRAAEIAKDNEARLLFVVDIHQESAEKLASQHHCQALVDWTEAVSSPEVDAVIVSTPNHLSAEIAIHALQMGKDLLVEKPFGRNFLESKAILDAATKSKRTLIVKTGFNHRFHPAIAKAKNLIDQGVIGKLLSLRARYGHGGRPGMEKEWRASKSLCGGGELLDQGIHIIDLMQWFGGGWAEVYASLNTAFWPMDVEDNAFVLGKTLSGADAMFHVSWTQWKNLFSFELFGSKGSLHIQGLGGSYGQETLECMLRKLEGGPPEIKTFSYPDEDISWKLEWEEFKKAIFARTPPLGNGEDGCRANQVIAAIEQSNLQKTRVLLHE